MSILKSTFTKCAAGVLTAFSLNACTPANPHQKGETYGTFAGLAVAAAAKAKGASDVQAGLAGLLVGTGVSAAVESSEPNCYEVTGGAQQTRTTNGYTDTVTVGKRQFVCKPRAMTYQQADVINGPYQAANPRYRAPSSNRSFGGNPRYNYGYGRGSSGPAMSGFR